MSPDDLKALDAERKRVKRALDKHGASLITAVEQGIPLRIALAQCPLDAELEPLLESRPEIVAARGRYELSLLRRVEQSNDAGALIRLEREFGYRKPPARTTAEDFGEQIALFAEWCQRNPSAKAPACYERLYQIVSQGAMTSTQKRAKHRSEGTDAQK